MGKPTEKQNKRKNSIFEHINIPNQPKINGEKSLYIFIK